MPIDSQSADPEHKARERFLKKTLGQLTACEKKMRASKAYFEIPKMKAYMGTINSQIIHSNPEPQTDRLTGLPREIGSAIWEHLTEPADRLMLALTCKYNAGMYEELKNVATQPPMIKPVKKRATKAATAAKPHGVSKKGRNAMLKGRKPETLTVLRRLQPWFKHLAERSPSTGSFDLCYICVRYLPKNASCDHRDFPERGGWGGRAFPTGELDGRKKITQKLLDIEGRRCPDCVVRKNTEHESSTSVYKDIMAIFDRLGSDDRT